MEFASMRHRNRLLAPVGLTLRPQHRPTLLLDHVTSANRPGFDDQAFQVHDHADLWHLVVVAEGRGSFHLGPRVQALAAPALILVAPGVPHCFQRSAGDSTVYSEVTFRVAGLVGTARSWSDLFLQCHRRAPAPLLSSAPRDLTRRMAELIDDLALLVDGDDADLPLMAQAALEHLVHLAWRSCRDTDPTADGLERLRLALEEGAAFDLAACARLAGLSRQHLCRAFTRRFGAPPLRYRRHAALRRAAALLCADEQPIADIAAACGFDDHRWFIRAFKARFGLPPGAFRQRQRQADVI
jgi:AraC-like DNA-binding protein